MVCSWNKNGNILDEVWTEGYLINNRCTEHARSKKENAVVDYGQAAESKAMAYFKLLHGLAATCSPV